MTKKPILISGIQPTGNLHIGNYLGAVKNWVDLQNSGKYRMFICIVDLLALTGNQSAEEVKKNTLNLAIELLAAGIDPKKTTLFVQSHVTGHTELAWLFNCITPLGELERMTQFKDKSSRQMKNINAGLLTYPALMASDILLYQSQRIPVGEDQVQHVELTRSIARWFNGRYGDYFTLPEVVLTNIPRVKSLQEPDKKMSKSHGEKNYIALCDDPEVIQNKLKKAVTASEGGMGSQGVQNLLGLLKEFGEKDVYEMYLKQEKDGTIQYGNLKKDLAQIISDTFSDFRVERKKYLSNQRRVLTILKEGAKGAQKVADKTLKEVYRLVGLR